MTASAGPMTSPPTSMTDTVKSSLAPTHGYLKHSPPGAETECQATQQSPHAQRNAEHQTEHVQDPDQLNHDRRVVGRGRADRDRQETGGVAEQTDRHDHVGRQQRVTCSERQQPPSIALRFTHRSPRRHRHPSSPNSLAFTAGPCGLDVSSITVVGRGDTHGRGQPASAAVAGGVNARRVCDSFASTRSSSSRSARSSASNSGGG